jgi:hypothetical protein
VSQVVDYTRKQVSGDTLSHCLPLFSLYYVVSPVSLRGYAKITRDYGKIARSLPFQCTVF